MSKEDGHMRMFVRLGNKIVIAVVFFSFPFLFLILITYSVYSDPVKAKKLRLEYQHSTYQVKRSWQVIEPLRRRAWD